MMHHRTTLASHPSVRPLNDPALWQGNEPSADFCSWDRSLGCDVQGSRRAVPGTPYDFGTDMVPLLDFASTRSSVRTVGVKLLEPRRLGTRLRDNCGSGISILHAPGGHCKGNDQTHRIDDQVALSSLDLLTCIESVFAALRRATIGLSINDRPCRLIGTPHSYTPLLTQPILHLFEHTCGDPTHKRFVDCLPGWKRCGAIAATRSLCATRRNRR